MATGGAAAGAATGGAGTGGRSISVARGFTGFEGDAQTKLIRAIFGSLGAGVTARDIYETTTPTAQCRAVIGEPDKCWVCGYAFTNEVITEKLGPAQCEHILPIVQAIMYLDLYSPKKLKSLSPQEKAKYIDFLKFEYRWAHQRCNLIKKGDVYISYNSAADRYEIKEYGLRMFISKIATILFKSKFKPSSPQYAKDMEKRKEFISRRVTSIRYNIYMPIVINLNSRWAGIDGKPVVAHGLDQLSAVASLLTAPMTAKGAAATAAAGGYPSMMLELPKTPAALYDTLLKRVTIRGPYGGSATIFLTIKPVLDANPFIKDEIIQLYSKIKIVARNKSQLKSYIRAVDTYAVSLAVKLIRNYDPSFGAGYTFGVVDTSIIDELKGISLITTIHALSDTAPDDIYGIEAAASHTDTNPVHTLSAAAAMNLKEEDESAAAEEVASVEENSLNTSVSSSGSGGSFYPYANSNDEELTERVPKTHEQALQERTAKRARKNSPPGYPPNSSMGGYRSTRRSSVRRRRVTRKKRHAF